MSLTPARLGAAALVAGLVLSLAMAALAQPGGDQLNLLARGWLLAERGELVPFGNPLSSGGVGPGPLTSVVVGVPLVLRSHHRSPVALVWLLHLGALALLSRTLRGATKPIELAAFAVLWALGPWRLVAGSTLWNPNFLVFFGAVHLASAAALSERPRFGATFVHVLALGLGAQLHLSMVTLVLLSFLLWNRGLLRLSVAGALAGVAATTASLLPWLVAVGGGLAPLAPRTGFPFRGLALVWPILKGLGYLLQYPSLVLAEELAHFDFGERLGADVDRWLAPAARAFVISAGAASVVVAALAWLLVFRTGERRLFAPAPSALGRRDWLERYVALAFVAAAAGFAISPTTPQGWQGLALLPVAALPVAWAAGRAAERWGESRTLRGLAAWALVALTLDLAIVLAAPDFRCAGRSSRVFPLRSHSAMFQDLDLQATCPWPLGVPGAWWPDVLPEEPISGPEKR